MSISFGSRSFARSLALRDPFLLWGVPPAPLTAPYIMTPSTKNCVKVFFARSWCFFFFVHTSSLMSTYIPLRAFASVESCPVSRSKVFANHITGVQAACDCRTNPSPAGWGYRGANETCRCRLHPSRVEESKKKNRPAGAVHRPKKWTPCRSERQRRMYVFCCG